jgi:hypothetical protein
MVTDQVQNCERGNKSCGCLRRVIIHLMTASFAERTRFHGVSKAVLSTNSRLETSPYL